MLKWSRYSHLFLSERNGWLLYNAAAGSFMKLMDGQEKIIEAVRKDPEGYDFSDCPQLYILLRSSGHLVTEGQDDDLYNILKMRRQTAQYAGNVLLLTVAITRNCNFDCSYCFEGNRTGKPMTEEVEDKLVEFIQKFKVRHRFITWYGGEPLLAFDRILSIDRKLKALDLPYRGMLVTNGFLLDERVIRELDNLRILIIQITLDGAKNTHDARRVLKGGGPTFDRIVKNLDALMASDYKGKVHIRVNVDARNEDEFMDVYRLIRERYPKDERIMVYPGFVTGDAHPDASCFFDSDSKGRFVANVLKKHGVSPMSLFPSSPAAGCTLTKRNAFVVGPDGELYKCWNDVGIPEAVVGHIDSFTDWNVARIAKGMVAASYLDDEECRRCFYFPVCDGGCHQARMKNLEDGGNRDVCSYFKHHLDELLELHYEQKQRQEQESADAAQ